MSDRGSATSPHAKISVAHVHAAGIAGLLALGAAAYALGVAPSMRAQERALMQQNAIARAGTRARTAQEQLNASQDELAPLRASVGSDPVEGDLLAGHLTGVASHFGLMPLGVDQSAAEPEGELTRTTLSLHAVGTFSDIHAFLTGLREQMPASSIDGFGIVPAPIESQGLTLVATVVVYAPQPSPAHTRASRSGGTAPARRDSAR